MKRGSTLFLKVAIIIIAAITIFSLIMFPQTEGRASNISLAKIYLDPLILYGYLASIPFFFGLYQAFKLLNLIDRNKAFSQNAVIAFKNMKLASVALIIFILGGILFIHFLANGNDPAGPTMLGLSTIFVISIIATIAGVFEKLIQNAVEIKSENDLTV